MTCLVDANVLCEATRPSPDPKVITWLRHNERHLIIDPVILGEIRFGIFLLPSGRRRRRLLSWFDEVVHRIHCVPWDAETGLRWAELLARLRSARKVDADQGQPHCRNRPHSRISTCDAKSAPFRGLRAGTCRPVRLKALRSLSR